MSASRKKVSVGDDAVFDISLIFSRVLCLHKVSYIDMIDVLGYELFDETGEMRLTKSKFTLKTKLQVQLTYRRAVPHDAIV